MSEDFIQTDEPVPGVQRLAAGFAGHAYDPHRHETYAIGRTLSGAQAFRYRGRERISRRGQCIVIHPDEVHDGHAGAPEGFRYHMVYVEPWLVRDAVGRQLLPYVPKVVAHDPTLAALLAEMYDDFLQSAESLAWDGFLARLGDLLLRRSDSPPTVRNGMDMSTEVAIARSILNEEFKRPIGSVELERLTGLDRFELARAFRRHTGTSPHRYLIGRRLAAARASLLAGAQLVDAAADAGFADQSHFTRHFKTRYGITPGRFAALARGKRRSSPTSG